VRVYLACTVRGDRAGVAAGRLIHDVLVSRGHEVLTAHLLDDDVESAEGLLTEREIFERDLRWLAACDVIVAEASGSSYGVGFEVGYVLGRSHETGQRAVLLYDATRTGAISRLIVGNAHERCVTYGYRSLNDLTAFLTAFVERGLKP